jgi:peptidoglycan/LPS O-acetylase OafA/YrhL
MMLSIYTIFLYNLSASVYIMKRVDAKKVEEAARFNRRALRILPILIVVLIIAQLVF